MKRYCITLRGLNKGHYSRLKGWKSDLLLPAAIFVCYDVMHRVTKEFAVCKKLTLRNDVYYLRQYSIFITSQPPIRPLYIEGSPSTK